MRPSDQSLPVADQRGDVQPNLHQLGAELVLRFLDEHHGRGLPVCQEGVLAERAEVLREAAVRPVAACPGRLLLLLRGRLLQPQHHVPERRGQRGGR